MTSNILFAVALLTCGCDARRVENPSLLKINQAQNPSLAKILSSLQLAYRAPISRSNHQRVGSHAFPHPRTSAYRMAVDEDEYGVEESELLTEEEEKKLQMQRLAEEDPELAKAAARIERGMKSATGAELAPWMKVDAEAILRAEKDRKMNAALIEKNRGIEVGSEAIAPDSIQIKQLDGTDDVEVRWKVADGNFLGYELERKTAAESNWRGIANFENDKTLLQSFAATNEGSFIVIDEAVGFEGGALYRVLAIQPDGKRMLLGEDSVQVDKPKSIAAFVFLGLLLAILLAVGVFGAFEDPIQTTR